MWLRYCLAVLFALVCIPASADTFFTLNGAGDTISFSLHFTDPVPGDTYFQYYDVPVTFNGVIADQWIQFGDGSVNGALAIVNPFPSSAGDFNVYDYGPPLFSGSVVHPVFTPGTYQLSNATGIYQDLTFTISDSPIAVTPEPSSSLLVFSGLLSLTYLLNRRLV